MTGAVAVDDLRASVLRALADWSGRGWIRALDAALARLVADLSSAADGSVLLATALVAHLEGLGHTCLVLDDLTTGADRVLRWSDEARDALARLMASMPSTEAAWIASLSRCDAVAVDGGDPDADAGAEPLVLSDGRLYLRRYWRYERRVARRLRMRSDQGVPVDPVAARHWLAALFTRDAANDGVVDGASREAVDWQQVACAIALRGRFSIVTGGPGTGKTFVAARFIALLHALAPSGEPLRVALAAPTGKAAARLQQSIEGAFATIEARLGDALPLRAFAARIPPARTLHALLGARPGTRRFRHDAAHPLDVDVVVVDEASMIHVEMMDALLGALPDHAAVLLLGDKDQLASVEAGAVLGELCSEAEAGRYIASTARYVEAVTGRALPAAMRDDTGPALAQQTVMLRRSQRFDGDIDRLAKAVNGGDAAAAIALLSARVDGPVAWSDATVPADLVDLALRGRPGAIGGYRTFLERVRRRPDSVAPDAQSAWVGDVLDAFESFRMLCALRAGEWGVEALNRAITARLADARTTAPGGEWYAGRPVMVTRNDPDVGVFNGDIGIALPASPRDATLRVYFGDGREIRSVAVGRLGAVETAFALTVHKSQGSEFAHTVLVLPPDSNPVTTRELVYTGVTRARTAFTLVAAQRDALVEAIAQTTRRSSGLIGFVRGD